MSTDNLDHCWTEISPTPWRLEEIATNSFNILDANGELIFSLITSNDDATDLDRANAEAIIRYVNSCAE